MSTPMFSTAFAPLSMLLAAVMDLPAGDTRDMAIGAVHAIAQRRVPEQDLIRLTMSAQLLRELHKEKGVCLYDTPELNELRDSLVKAVEEDAMKNLETIKRSTDFDDFAATAKATKATFANLTKATSDDLPDLPSLKEFDKDIKA